MEPYQPRKRRWDGKRRNPQVAQASRTADFGEVVIEQFDTPERKDQHVPAANVLNNIYKPLGWTADYTYPDAGAGSDNLSQYFGRLELKGVDNAIVAVFDHKRPETNTRVAKDEVAERALRWVEARKIALTSNIQEPYLELFDTEQNCARYLRKNPAFRETKGFFLALAQVISGNNGPMVPSPSDSPACQRDYTQLIKGMKTTPTWWMKHNHCFLLGKLAKAWNKFQISGVRPQEITPQELEITENILEREWESYKANIVSEPKKSSICSYELSGIQMLQILQENLSTRKFESVTVPFATVRFTAGDLSFASRIGTALAEAVLSRLDKNTTTNNASAILGYIVAGMQEVSSRADRVSPQIIDAADPEYTQATYSNSQESSAVDQASEQLKKFQQNAAIEQVAERLMNAWETSDDTMKHGFGVARGFQSTSEAWVEDLIRKEAKETGVDIDEVRSRAKGEVDIKVTASASQQYERAKVRAPIVLRSLREWKGYSEKEMINLLFTPKPEDFPTAKNEEGICLICRNKCA